MVALNSALTKWAISTVAGGYWGSYLIAHCDLSSVQLTLPASQLAVLGQPNSSHPTAVGVAFGVQNYTCSANNNFTCVGFLADNSGADLGRDSSFFSSTGAVAQLYDISCLYHASPDLFNTIQEPLYEAWTNLSSEVTVQQITAVIPALVSPEVILADHYFVPSPAGTGLSPVWDFRATKSFHDNPNAFMLGASAGSVVSPVDPSDNINWLRVRKVSGEVADEVYRTDTIGGQPPTSVTFLFLVSEAWTTESCSLISVHIRTDQGYQCQVHLPILVLWWTTLIKYAALVRHPTADSASEVIFDYFLPRLQLPTSISRTVRFTLLHLSRCIYICSALHPHLPR